MSDRIWIPIYFVVIAAAMTLEVPWMIAIQAAMGGFGLGYKLGTARMPLQEPQK